MPRNGSLSKDSSVPDVKQNAKREGLKRLHQEREEKRKDFQELFQQKRALQQKMQALDREMEALQDVLFQMDEEIGDLEDHSPNHSELLPENMPASPTGMGSSSKATTRITTHNSTHFPQSSTAASIPETSANTFLLDPCPKTSEPSQEQLTDPLSSTQTPGSDLVAAPCAIDPIIAHGRQQLVLQTINRNTSQNRRMDDFLTKSTPSNEASLGGANRPPTRCPFSIDTIQKALTKTFKIKSFRENQQSIIQATLAGEDCFVIMRTGGGKSLLYQLPVSLERPRISLVISPLLSLMQDQENQMNDFCKNICVSFHSGLTNSQQAANWQRVRDPDQMVGMILVTPEMVYQSNKLKSELQKLYDQNRFARIVIDECHCCCQWGHDFRPNYAKLGVLRSTFPSVPILAVTATASDRVRDDCCKILKLRREYRFFRSTANRPNLRYAIRRKDGSGADTVHDIVDFIKTKHPSSPGIVYTLTKRDANTLAAQLVDMGIVAEAYHSDVSPSKKTKIHKSWMRNKTQVVVATIAFGLGINKPDVRFVVHHCMSKTLEAYYQESGRAGRDGNPADCVLYYSPKDVPRMMKFVLGEQSEPLLWTMIKYAQHFGSDAVCRAILLHNLGEPGHRMQAVLEAEEGTDGCSRLTRDVLSHAQTVLQLLFLRQADNVTLPMLVKEWRSNPKTAAECVRNNPPGKELCTYECEYIIVSLILQKIIGTNVQFKAYDAVVYLRCTDKAEHFLTSPKAKMTIKLPAKDLLSKKSSKVARKSTSGSADSDGWIQTKKTTSGKRKLSSSTKAAKQKSSKGVRKKSMNKTGKKVKVSPTEKEKSVEHPRRLSSLKKLSQATILAPEVISIDDDSCISEENEALVDSGKSLEGKDTSVDDLMVDSDSEYEFEG